MACGGQDLKTEWIERTVQWDSVLLCFIRSEATSNFPFYTSSILSSRMLTEPTEASSAKILSTYFAMCLKRYYFYKFFIPRFFFSFILSIERKFLNFFSNWIPYGLGIGKKNCISV